MSVTPKVDITDTERIVPGSTTYVSVHEGFNKILHTFSLHTKKDGIPIR